MKRKQYIYVNLGDCSVFESQVLELLQHIQNNYDLDVWLYQGYHSQLEKITLEKKLAKYNIHVKWFRAYPKYIGVWWLTKITFASLLNSIAIDEHVYFHVRGFESGVLLKSHLMRVGLLEHLLVDVRGVPIEENMLYGKSRIKSILKKWFYTIIIYQLRYYLQPKITTVSEKLKEYLIQHYHFNNDKISVHPNICSQTFVYDEVARQSIRKALGVKNDELLFLCATGGGAAWQNDKIMITKLAQAGYKFINLSPNAIDSPNVCNKVVPFDYMPNYLSAADVAILWREDNPVNNVASPSKFSEFAVMGLYVIHNGTVDLAKKHIEKYESGCIVTDVDNVKLPPIQEILAKRISWIDFGKEMFSVDIISRDYLRVLNIL